MAAGTERMIKHSTIYAIGTLSRQLVGFLMLPVYTRYMTPADYGVIGLLAFTLSLMEPLFGARLAEAIPKFYYEQKDDRGRAAVISSAFAITGGMTALVACLIFLFKQPASELLFGNSTYALAVGLFGLQIFTQALEYYGLTYIRMQQKPYIYVVVSLAKLAMQLGLNIWFVVILKMGVMGVVVGGCISSVLFAVGLVIYTLWQSGIVFDAALGKRMVLFNVPLWFSGMAALYIFSANRYYMRIFSSLDQIGFYELAARFSGVLTLLVWTSFSQYWEMERFRLYQAGAPNPAYSKVFRFISTLLIIFALGISVFADPVITIMSAAEFHAASSLVPVLTLAMLFSCLSNFSSFSLLVTEKTKIINQNSYLAVIIISVCNFVLIPKLGGIGAAYALLVALASQFFIINFRAKQFYDMGLRLSPFLVMLLIAVAGYVAAELLSHNFELILKMAIRALVYTATVVVLGGVFLRDKDSRAQVLGMVESLSLRLGLKRARN